MKIFKYFIIVVSIFFSVKNSLASNSFGSLETEKTERQLIKTSNDKGWIASSHARIESDFMKAVLQQKSPNTLEVGPGNGPTLKKILEDPRNIGNPVKYTVTELCKDHIKDLKDMIEKTNQNEQNWFGFAKNGDIREFIKDKKDKYDLIYCAQVLHFFDPLDQYNVMTGLYASLKEGATIYLLTNSILACPTDINRLHPQSSENEKQDMAKELVELFVKRSKAGNLWPGYTADGLHYHSVETLQNFLTAIGFKITKSHHISETFSTDSVERMDVKIGIIASKSSAKPNATLLEKYLNQANYCRKYFKE